MSGWAAVAWGTALAVAVWAPILAYHRGWVRGFDQAKATYQPHLDAAYKRELEAARGEDVTQRIRMPRGQA